MARAGEEVIRKEVPVQKSRSAFSEEVLSAPAWSQHFKIKLYIDELEVGDLLGVLVRLPLYLIDVIKEEWFWWFKLYPYEISSPVDWEKERAKGLAESRRRIKKFKG